MIRSHTRTALLLVIVVAFAVCATVPALAYDKLFRFKNRTGSTQNGAKVTLNGLEVTLGQYTTTLYNKWGEGSVGFEVSGGVYNTTITWPSATGTTYTYSPLEQARLGWNTSDGSCRLQSFVWLNGATPTSVVSATEYGDVPGGGALRYDENDVLYWYIINDTTGSLQIEQLQVVPFGGTPDPVQQQEIAETIADIGVTGQLILELLEGLARYNVEGGITDPSYSSLLNKLLGAYEDNEAAYAYQDAGELRLAEKSWTAAARQVSSFIKQLKTARDKGTVREDAYDELNGIAETAYRLLSQLPAVDPVTVAGGVLEPLETLLPGEEFAIDLSALSEDGVSPLPENTTVVVSGTVRTELDGDVGEVVLNWVDQVVVKYDLTPPSPYATPAAEDTGATLQVAPGTTVTLNSGPGSVIWYDVEWEPPGTVIDPSRRLPELLADPVAPGEECTLDALGTYEITFLARDGSGNVSAPKVVRYEVIDTVPPTIEGADFWPEVVLWSPNHEWLETPIEVTGIGIEDNVDPPGAQIHIVVTDDEGSDPDDWYWELSPTNPHVALVWLRSERDGGGDGRTYTITARAVDAVGLLSEESFPETFTVAHDQSSG